METKPLNSISRDIIRSFLIEKVIPAIKRGREKTQVCLYLFSRIMQEHILIMMMKNFDEQLPKMDLTFD
ncbi:hypothetical protein RDI58_029985 [Solanum bulbocastanum]|uniref:Uncharacterized protein n=1 Tax=Solanum bulbocastanum TaxID=147425 RepID=A0AAN8Y0H0_SOLBU